MWFRVFWFTLLCGAIAAPLHATVRHPEEVLNAAAISAAAPRRAALAQALYANQTSQDDAADPMDDTFGHAMWDAVGTGCVDGGGWSEPFPTGKGDLRSPAFCVPQPCARQLTQEELAEKVLGRLIRAAEWETYLIRYADRCLTAAGFPALPLKDLASLLASLGSLGDWIGELDWTLVAQGKTTLGTVPPTLPHVLVPPAAEGPVAQVRRTPRRDARPPQTWSRVSPLPMPEIGKKPRALTPKELPIERPLPVPLPASHALMIAALGGLALVRSRQPSGRRRQ